VNINPFVTYLDIVLNLLVLPICLIWSLMICQALMLLLSSDPNTLYDFWKLWDHITACRAG
jgi:hypothetical protein